MAYSREALGNDALKGTMLCHQNGLLPDLQDVCSDAMQRQSDVSQVGVEQEVVLSPIQFEPRADKRASSSRKRSRA